mgnify:FL=1
MAYSPLSRATIKCNFTVIHVDLCSCFKPGAGLASAVHKAMITKSKSARDYPAVDELVKFITGEDTSGNDPPKLDKKQRKKLKKVRGLTIAHRGLTWGWEICNIF